MERNPGANRDLPETRDRAVRIVVANEGGHADRATAIRAIAPKIGFRRESLRRGVIGAGVDDGTRNRLSLEERDRISSLEREVRKLR